MVKQKETVLRVLFKPTPIGLIQVLEIFLGDIEKDRKYQKKYQNTTARYFKLGKEIK